MSRRNTTRLAILGILVIGFMLGYMVAYSNTQPSTLVEAAEDQQTQDATAATKVEASADQTATAKNAAVGIMSPRDMYFPGTEELKPDEMRVVACGTGMPASRRGQAATCWLVELGNGDKFLFDIGTGSAANIGSLNIPYDYLDKVFMSHLHTDHMGDLDALWVGGWTGGRHGGLHVWGPSGAKPETGTKYCIEHIKKAFTWDYTGRLGVIPTGGGGLDVHEFDYKQVNEVVYQENGVTIRSWPAIHCIDGAVSYGLEWNGLKFVFGGDTVPNEWYIKYAKGSDFAIHECFMTPDLMMEKYGFSPQAALNVATAVHCAPAAFGKVMAEVKPRMAVAYHFFNDYDTRFPIYQGIRKSYDGPLTMATDLLVWNITKDDIRVREAIVDENAWPAKSLTKPDEPDPKAKTPFTPEMDAGRLDVDKAFKDTIDAYKKKHNLK